MLVISKNLTRFRNNDTVNGVFGHCSLCRPSCPQLWRFELTFAHPPDPRMMHAARDLRSRVLSKVISALLPANPKCAMCRGAKTTHGEMSWSAETVCNQLSDSGGRTRGSIGTVASRFGPLPREPEAKAEVQLVIGRSLRQGNAGPQAWNAKLHVERHATTSNKLLPVYSVFYRTSPWYTPPNTMTL